MRSLGAPGGEVAVEVGSEEVQRGVGAARIDVEVLEVIAHDERIRSGDMACYVNCQLPLLRFREDMCPTYRGVGVRGLFPCLNLVLLFGHL